MLKSDGLPDVSAKGDDSRPLGQSYHATSADVGLMEKVPASGVLTSFAARSPAQWLGGTALAGPAYHTSGASASVN
jgi:hypothetical protein